MKNLFVFCLATFIGCAALKGSQVCVEINAEGKTRVEVTHEFPAPDAGTAPPIESKGTG